MVWSTSLWSLSAVCRPVIFVVFLLVPIFKVQIFSSPSCSLTPGSVLFAWEKRPSCTPVQNNMDIIYTNCDIVSSTEPKDNSLWQWNKKVVDFWSKSVEKHIDCEDHYVFTGARDKLIQSTPLQPIYVRSILLFFQLRLDPPVGLFLSGFPTKTLYAFLCGEHCSCVNTRLQL